ncbi:MAG TPA: signal peptidase II [Polyangia bacterium]|jgi:lipoprotein signal peptidase
MDEAARPARSRGLRRYLLLVVIVAAVVADDQATKRYVERNLRGRVVRVMPGFDLRYVRNPGAAWGLFADVRERVRRPFFAGVSVLAMAFILLTYSRAASEQRRLRVALALVCGGAAGNFIDRVSYGYVVDFIDWHVHLMGRPHHWPTFNVADAAITLGVLMIALELIPARAPAAARAPLAGGAPSAAAGAPLDGGEPPAAP